MNTGYSKPEIEKTKPLTERQRAERVATIDRLIERLKRHAHIAPCPRHREPMFEHGSVQGHCTCWHSIAVVDLERAKDDPTVMSR